MELLPVRSFFAEALASLYAVSGQKSADQRARDLEEKMPATRASGGGDDNAGGGGGDDDVGAAAAGLGAVEAAAEGGGEEEEPLRPRRVRRFRS